jgi:sugar/nucleoside kinase (ribokinase family)
MSPGFHAYVPSLLTGIDAFLPSRLEADSYFSKPLKVWEMAEAFQAMGPPIVVLKAGASGQYVFDGPARKRWHVPAYPTEPRDVTGAGDAFCGAFLVALSKTQDPLEATLHGNIAASFVIEGSGATYALDSPSALRTARLEHLRERVRKE